MAQRWATLATASLIAATCAFSNLGMATDNSLGRNAPPTTYRLDQVSLRLTQQPGNRHFPVRQLTLSGRGTATLRQGEETRPVAFADSDLVETLNALYRLRFFDLASDYTTRQVASQQADGTIIVGRLRPSDAGSTSVCATIAGYEKCVTYGADGPTDLEALVRRLFERAEAATR